MKKSRLNYLNKIRELYPNIDPSDVKFIKDEYNTTYQKIYQLLETNITIGEMEHIFNVNREMESPPSIKSLAMIYTTVENDLYAFLEAMDIYTQYRGVIKSIMATDESMDSELSDDYTEKFKETTRICYKLNQLLKMNYSSPNLLQEYLDNRLSPYNDIESEDIDLTLTPSYVDYGYQDYSTAKPEAKGKNKIQNDKQSHSKRNKNDNTHFQDVFSLASANTIKNILSDNTKIEDGISLIEIINKNAINENEKALYLLSYLYEKGYHVKKDIEKSINLLIKAANLGYAEAQFDIGERYYFGDCVNKNYSKAYDYYARSAMQGCNDANEMLGLMLYTGKGVSQDFSSAYKYMDLQSLSFSECDSRFYLAKKSIDIAKKSIDIKLTSNITKETANFLIDILNNIDKNELFNRYVVASQLYKGIEVPKNLELALEIFSEIAKSGYSKSQYIMGHLYYYGEGVKQSYLESLIWYEKAANQGVVLAQSKVGHMYLYSIGTESNIEKAKYYFDKAAKGGDEIAIYNLDLLENDSTD